MGRPPCSLDNMSAMGHGACVYHVETGRIHQLAAPTAIGCAEFHDIRLGRERYCNWTHVVLERRQDRWYAINPSSFVTDFSVWVNELPLLAEAQLSEGTRITVMHGDSSHTFRSSDSFSPSRKLNLWVLKRGRKPVRSSTSVRSWELDRRACAGASLGGLGLPFAASSLRCGLVFDTGASAPGSICSATNADKTSVSMEMSSVSYDLSCVCHRAGGSLRPAFAQSRPAMMERPAAWAIATCAALCRCCR